MSLITGWNEFLTPTAVSHFRDHLGASLGIVDHMILLCTNATAGLFGRLCGLYPHVRPGLKMTSYVHATNADGTNRWTIDSLDCWKAAAADLSRMLAQHRRPDASLVVGLGWETAMGALRHGVASYDPLKLRKCVEALAAVIPPSYALQLYPGLAMSRGSVYDNVATIFADVFGRDRLYLAVGCYASKRTLFAPGSDTGMRAWEIARAIYILRMLRPVGEIEGFAACEDEFHDCSPGDASETSETDGNRRVSWSAIEIAHFIRAAREIGDHSANFAVWTAFAGMPFLETVRPYL
jgi:hypothetical protein